MGSSFIFLIGAVVGWVVHHFFQEHKQQKIKQLEPASQKELAAAESEIRELRAQLARYERQEGQLKEYQAQLQTKTEELQNVSRLLTDTQTQLETLREQLAATEVEAQAVTETPAKEPPKMEEPPVQPDDLRRIQGIGPKIAQVLNESGIRTFEQLAQADVDRLRAILQEVGPHLKWVDPTSWPEQAGLAAKGDWEALKKLQSELSRDRDQS